MPHITISMYKGRDEETKQNIATKTRAFLAQEMNMDPSAFTVAICDYEKDDFQKDVLDKVDPKTLYCSNE